MKQNKAIRQKLENVLYVITTWKMSSGTFYLVSPSKHLILITPIIIFQEYHLDLTNKIIWSPTPSYLTAFSLGEL